MRIKMLVKSHGYGSNLLSCIMVGMFVTGKFLEIETYSLRLIALRYGSRNLVDNIEADAQDYQSQNTILMAIIVMPPPDASSFLKVSTL